VRGEVKRNGLKVETVSLNSKRFWVKVWGELGEKSGTLFFKGEVKPLSRGNFFMKEWSFEGTATVKLPYVFLIGKAKEPIIRVKDKVYGNLKGLVGGYYKLFEKLRLSGSIWNEDITLEVDYKVLPENKLYFYFSGVPVDNETLGIKGVNLLSLWNGRGELLLREGILSVEGEAKAITLEGRNLGRGKSFFRYLLKERIGSFILLLEDKGYFSLSIDGKFLEGFYTLRGLPVGIRGYETLISGTGSIRKREALSLIFNFFMEKNTFRGVSIPDLRGELSLRERNVKLNLTGRGLELKATGELKHLSGFTKFRDFLVFYKNLEVRIKRGAFNFEFGKAVLLRGEANVSISAGNRKIEEDLFVSVSADGKRMELSGFSPETELKAYYSFKNKRGYFLLRKNHRAVSVFLKGEVKDKVVAGSFESFFRIGRDILPFTGSFSVGNGEASLRLDRKGVRGEIFDYNFRGFYLSVKEGGSVEGYFGGASLFLLDKKFLEISKGEIKGRIDDFRVSPLKIRGVMEGEVEVIRERGFSIRGKGTLDLSLLSDFLSSVVRSRFEGRVKTFFLMTERGFRLVLNTDKPVYVKSEFFYEPFTASLSVLAENKNFQFSGTSWFQRGFIIAYALSKDYRNFEIFLNFENAPLRFVNGVRARLTANGSGRIMVKELKKIYADLKTEVEGFVKVFQKPERNKESKGKKYPVDVTINVRFASKDGVEIIIPEGRILTSLKGRVYGSPERLYYNITANIRAGRVNYFGREFFLRKSQVLLVKEEGKEETLFSLFLNTYVDTYKIFLRIYGSQEDPEVYYFSEPPLSREEILLSLIGGAPEEGILPVGEALTKELRAIGTIKGYLERLLDLRISFGIITTSTGEMGAVARLRKNLGRFFAVVYQASSLQERRSSYVGLMAKPPLDLELGFQFNVYSDSSREYKFRYIKEFDF